MGCYCVIICICGKSYFQVTYVGSTYASVFTVFDHAKNGKEEGSTAKERKILLSK